MLYGVLDDGEARTVRVPFTGYKVDVIAGAGVWDLFEPFGTPSSKPWRNTRRSGSGRPSSGPMATSSSALPQVDGPADPFAAAGRLSPLPAPSASSRHPVHIAEPVRLPGDHGLPGIGAAHRRDRTHRERRPGSHRIARPPACRSGRLARATALRPIQEELADEW